MENQGGFFRLTRAVFASFSREDNQGIAAISGIGGIFCGLHIIDADINYILVQYSLIIKIVGSVLTVVVAPPLGVFMKDVYEVKVKPNIKFLKKKD